MARYLLPDARLRSPTAVRGKSDLRDENVYSAILVNGGASGSQRMFTVPQGQAIPRLGTGGTVPTHASTHSETTTNLTKAGELGSAIGDAAVRALGVTYEAAQYTASSGALGVYGCGQIEAAELNNKTYLEFKIAGKRQIIGNIFMFPSMGGVYGSVSTTGNAATVATVANGATPGGRKLKIPVQVARTDVVEAIFGVASGAGLTFTGSTQFSLIWCSLSALVKGDVR